jgi:hypothetical protein
MNNIRFYTADTKDTSIIAYGSINGKRGIKVTFKNREYHVSIKKGKGYNYYSSYPADILLDGVIKKVTVEFLNKEI